MKRSQKSVLLGLALVVPAAAQAFLPPKHPCFASGAATQPFSAKIERPGQAAPAGIKSA